MTGLWCVWQGSCKLDENLSSGRIKVDLQYSEPFSVDCFRPIWQYKYNVLVTTGISHFRVKGALDAFNKIVAESGVKGLYRGVVPNVQRAALVNMGGKHVFPMKSSNEELTFCSDILWVSFSYIYIADIFYFLAML